MSEVMWDKIIDQLELKLGDIDIEDLEETREDDTGQKIVAKIKRVEAEISGRKIRIEKVTTPLILDRKTHYSHSSANRTMVEYVVSDSEFTTKVRAYMWDDVTANWQEINLNQGFF